MISYASDYLELFYVVFMKFFPVYVVSDYNEN